MEDPPEHPPVDTRQFRESLRLTFRFEGEQVELVSVARVEMIAPASPGPVAEGGRHSGTWLDLRDRRRYVLFRRLLHDPFETRAEHHLPEGGIEVVERPVESGEFEVLVPALPDAAEVVLWSSPPGLDNALVPAREAARFDLSPHLGAQEQQT